MTTTTSTSCASVVTCNGCWAVARGKAFKTLCDHCYCEACLEKLSTEWRRRCVVCKSEVNSILQFQVVDAPIPDDQLVDVRSTLQTIACANGASFLETLVSGHHRFERVQLTLWGGRQNQEAQAASRDAQARERDMVEAEHAMSQSVNALEHKVEQLRSERDAAQKGIHDLQAALDERSRQAENWRAMYESLKSGERVLIPVTASTSSSASSANKTPVSSRFGLGLGGSGSGGRDSVSMPRDLRHALLAEEQQQQQHPHQQSALVEFETAPPRKRFHVFGSPPQPQPGGPPSFRTSSAQRPIPNISGFGGNGGSFLQPIPRSSTLPLNGTGGGGIGLSYQQRFSQPRPSSTATSFHADQVRSTFFAPSSLRAVTPSLHQHLPRSSHSLAPQGGAGDLFLRQ